MKSSTMILLGILFTSLSFLLPSHADAQAAKVDKDVLPSALLWKIEHKDMKEPSYLFGTIHMIPEEAYFYPAGFDEAFDSADDVVFEIDMDDMSGMGSLMGMLANLLMQDGTTISELLSKEEYAEVSAYFDNMGLPMVLLDRVKPMFLSMLAEINMDPAAMQSEDIKSYEMVLYEKAQAAKKEVGGLESMGYQMSLFDSIPYRDQAIMLVEAVRGTSTESDMFDETLDLYTKQNIEAMVTLISESESAEGADFEDLLLNNRNHNWIPVMKDYMKDQSVFFAVGAGHLGGANGVIRLLRKEGYKVTPVSVYSGQKQRL